MFEYTLAHKQRGEQEAAAKMSESAPSMVAILEITKTGYCELCNFGFLTNGVE